MIGIRRFVVYRLPEVFLRKRSLDRKHRIQRHGAYWFASPAITTAAIVSCVILLGLIFHELYRKEHPVLQLRLLPNRNFALASGMIFFTYFAWYASTALLPEFTHGMLGYTATSSGLVLFPCCIAIAIAEHLSLMP